MRKLKESSVSDKMATGGELDHEAFLRKSFDVARRARENGNHPFGAILVGPQGELLIECENGFMPDHDMTAHAERLLATQVSRTYESAFLARCTMYASAEPCAMCAGAVYWAGIGRVVFGMTERRLKALTGNHTENPTLDLPCRTVFAAGQRRVEVIGPLLEDEAEAVHAGAWGTPR
jgi:tRNA(Arg) A34 adenosine deaminase TadA